MHLQSLEYMAFTLQNATLWPPAINLAGHLVVTGGLRHSHRGGRHGAAGLLAERGAVGVATGATGAKACHLRCSRRDSPQ